MRGGGLHRKGWRKGGIGTHDLAHQREKQAQRARKLGRGQSASTRVRTSISPFSAAPEDPRKRTQRSGEREKGGHMSSEKRSHGGTRRSLTTAWVYSRQKGHKKKKSEKIKKTAHNNGTSSRMR